MQIGEIRPYVKAVREALFSYRGVRSVGVGFVHEGGKLTKELGIIVGVEEKLPEAMLNAGNILPRELAGTGIRIDVIKSGSPVPLPHSFASPDYDCSPYETMRSGVDLAHYQVTGGTLGDYRPDWGLGTSNNHVLAASNGGIKGDPIMQPSPICNSPQTRVVGVLDYFVPVKFLGSASPCSIANGVSWMLNLFARAGGRNTRLKALHHLQPFAENTVNHCDLAFCVFAPEVPVDGQIERTSKAWLGSHDEAFLGEKHFKSGARTRYTEKLCTQKYMTVTVQYGPGQVAVYEDQDAFEGGFLDAGDSGSMAGLLSTTKRTDLLFAGSDTMGIGSPYKYVVSEHDAHYGG